MNRSSLVDNHVLAIITGLLLVDLPVSDAAKLVKTTKAEPTPLV